MSNAKNIVLLTNKIEPPSFNQASDSGDIFQLVIFQSDMLFSYDGKSYFKVPAYSVILYRPHSIQTYKSFSGPVQNSFIYVDYEEEYFNKLNIPINTVIVLRKDDVEQLVFDLDRLSYVVNTPYAESFVPKIPEYTNDVFVKLAKFINETSLNVNNSTLMSTLLNIRAMMFNNPSEFTVKRMSQEIGFTETYFGIKYKEFFGITPNQDRKIQIVEKIKRYLRDTDYSLDQIADLCSIKSTAHLINTFKSVENTTPYQYKKAHK